MGSTERQRRLAVRARTPGPRRELGFRILAAIGGSCHRGETSEWQRGRQRYGTAAVLSHMQHIGKWSDSFS
ncbi:unnamed protein product [Urochloa humidicola]